MTDGPLILVVDDIASNVEMLTDFLTARGYRVVAASNGADALALINAHSPHLVLLDVMMPGMSGYEVCAAIRANPSTAILPVIMVTALDAKEARIQGLEAGADDFLSKPVNQQELVARVRSLIRIKHLYDELDAKNEQLRSWNRDLEERVRQQVAEVERHSRLKRFLSPQVADILLSSDTESLLKSHRREITVVFLDLRGFTSFTETADPEEVVRVINEYHAAMGRLVQAHEGTLERFAGDGIMIFFNDPLPIPAPATQAARMALEMQSDFSKLATVWKMQGYDLKMGIGIAQGYATLGTIGFEGRWDYGAIGSVCNLANRLCAEASGGEILVSPRVVSAIGAGFVTEHAGDLTLRGFARAVATHRLLSRA